MEERTDGNQTHNVENFTLDLEAWQSIRSAIGNFDSLVMTLLTQGTLLVFAALGIVFSNADKLGVGIQILLSIGVLFGTAMLHIGVSRYSNSIVISVNAAKQLEERLWPNSVNPCRITSHLSEHPIAAAKVMGQMYYRLWSYILFLISLIVIGNNVISMLSPET